MTKALFFDIDGTLVSFETHRIPSSTIEALEAAHAKGLKIFIATGRPKAIINNLSELPNDPNSLLHNLIYQIAEDKQHNIWVLTEKGIARYQQQSNDFTFPTDEDGKNITAYSFCLVPDGILFGGKDRIYNYSYNDSSLRLLQYFNANSFKINALSMWDSKTLLCCSRWTGIYTCNNEDHQDQ